MTTNNRGKQSSDDKWFAPKYHPLLTEAVNDLCYLQSRGYTDNSALQIVGNHYRLNKRQRNAVLRVSCGEKEIIIRSRSEKKSSNLKDKIIEIDGFNLLILLESALSGAFIFKGRDGLYRDISSVHGSYKRVVKTEEAILLVGKVLKSLKVKSVKWYLDKPVSNSGRLKSRLLEIGRNNDFNWDAELVFDPDKVLIESQNVVVSSDGMILESVGNWFNMSAYLVENKMIKANIVIV